MIVTLEKVALTPAGVPRQRIWLEHRSRQLEDGHPREVQARIAVILAGGMTQQAAGLKEGQRIKVIGCLSRAGYKGDARGPFAIACPNAAKRLTKDSTGDYPMARFYRRRKFCRFTAEGVEYIDYKDLDTLEGLHHRDWQDRAQPYYRHQGTLPASAGLCYQAGSLPGAAAVL